MPEIAVNANSDKTIRCEETLLTISIAQGFPLSIAQDITWEFQLAPGQSETPSNSEVLSQLNQLAAENSQLELTIPNTLTEMV